MPQLAFRVYNNGASLIAVAFPEEGGSAVLKDSWQLEHLDLELDGSPDEMYDMPYGTMAGDARCDLKVTIDYDAERVKLTPFNYQGHPLEEKVVWYTFSGLSVQNSDDKTGARTISVHKERKDISSETWP